MPRDETLSPIHPHRTFCLTAEAQYNRRRTKTHHVYKLITNLPSLLVDETWGAQASRLPISSMAHISIQLSLSLLSDYENFEQVTGLSMDDCQFSFSAAYTPFSSYPQGWLTCLSIPNPPKHSFY